MMRCLGQEKDRGNGPMMFCREQCLSVVCMSPVGNKGYNPANCHNIICDIKDFGYFCNRDVGQCSYTYNKNR